MFQEDQVPDAARKMLARFGTSIEFSEHYPDGMVNLTSSEIADDDLQDLIFYPGLRHFVLIEQRSRTEL